MRAALPLFLFLTSCSSLNPFSGGLPSLPGGGSGTPASGPLKATGVTIDQIGNFAWLSVILVLFFPKMREPLVHLWTAIFGTLAIPFLFAKDWAERYRERKRAK